MSLLQRIHDELAGVVTGAGALWHTKLEPWMHDFLSNVAHAEVAAVMPIVQGVVSEAAQDLVKAARSGDWRGFIDTQGRVLNAAAAQIGKQVEGVAMTSVTSAVAMAIAAHPDVVAAQAAAKTEAPQREPEPQPNA